MTSWQQISKVGKFNTRGELYGAIRSYESRVKSNPSDGALRVSYASLLYIAGDFDDSEREARETLKFKDVESDASRIMAKILYLRGQYSEATDFLERVISANPSDQQLYWELAQCHLRMNNYREAARIFEEHKFSNPLVPLVQKVAEKPALQISGEKDTTVVPLLQVDPLPVIEIGVNGKQVFAFIDTGGPFFSTNIEFARKEGYQILSSQTGDYALKKNAPVEYLQMDSVSIGEFVLQNVPGCALEGIRPQFGKYTCEDCIGTGILNQFLSTIDYPNRRLILTKRNNPRAKNEHFKLLGERCGKVPFFMALDHHLIAKGSLNGRENLTFFVDSGLAAIGQPDPNGPVIQAAFMMPYSAMIEFGIIESSKEITFPYFYEIASLGLGSLIQQDLYGFLPSREGERFNFDGIMIDGLISHAFLRNYAWTLDFDNHEFIFTK